ncbi:MAG: magnesium transporter, partial [Candidatus Promineifilaceae bacterium]
MTNPATPTLEERLDSLRAALEANDIAGALAILQNLHPSDQAELLDELEAADQVTILPALDPGNSADILEEMDEDKAAELVAALPTDTVISIVDEMEPDEAADLLGDLKPDQARAVLAGVEDPEEIRPLLLHPDDSAGGLMTSEFLALRRRTTVAEAIQAIRDWQPKTDTLSDLYVIDREDRLCGVVNLRELIAAPPESQMADIMAPDVISVRLGTDQEAVAQIMSRYSLLTLPVVDTNNVLVGIITIDDVVDVLEDEATEDIQRL